MKNTTHVADGAAITEAVVRPLSKGIGFLDQPLDSGDVVKLGWNLLREDLSLPTAVLYEEKIAHNLAWMQNFADAYGAKFAPHGKTSMAPLLPVKPLR